MLKNYFVSGNTAEGFVDYLSSNLHGIKETVRIDQESRKMNTAILEQLIANNRGKTDIEVLKSPITHRYIDGVIFRSKQMAVLGDMKAAFTDKAYDFFQKGLRIHDELEKIYIDEMDFKKADELAHEFIDDLLKDVPKRDKEPYVFKRLFGTNTAEGSVNEVPNLIENLKEIYHIKGRAGTGKSTFMRKVANACLDRGLDLEMYHCSFDPNSIDMVLIPELSVCLFDSTDPHAFEPEDKHRERVIDLYEETVTPGTDEKYAEEIQKLTKEYKGYMKQGLKVIKEEAEKMIAEDDKKAFSQKEANRIAAEIQTKLNLWDKRGQPLFVPFFLPISQNGHSISTI